MNPNKHKRKFSITVLFCILFQLLAPVSSYALTGGPSQAEYESFEPAGATEMVNLATGDFVYNIPLMDVDGYPINIAYHGGVSMEQEASWVGLGWNLNVGSISRSMRGLPDDFNGDILQDSINIKDNKTYGLNYGLGAELFGVLGTSLGYGISYNNYKGLGLEFELGVSGSLHATGITSGGISGGLGLKISNQDGTDFTMDYSLSSLKSYVNPFEGASKSRSKTYNSRLGLTSDMIGVNKFKGFTPLFQNGTGSSINLIPNTAYLPSQEYSTEFLGITGEVHLGAELFWCNGFGYMRGHYFNQSIDNKVTQRLAYGYLNLENAGLNSMLDFNRDKDGTYYLECPKIPFANLTYDVFSTNAQGLNEVFRPYRNDFGTVYDNITSSHGKASDVGIELNVLPNLIGLGYNSYGITSSSTSGKWINANNNFGTNYFHSDNQLTNTGSDKFEHVYFKAIDELVVEDPTFYNSIGKNKTASFELTHAGVASMLNTTLISDAAATYSGEIKTNRDVRNTNFSFLTIDEAKKVSVTNNSTSNKNDIVSYPINSFSYTSSGDISSNNTSNIFINRNMGLSDNGHHLSEVTVLKEDGSRYLYGIPVYNTSSRQEVFNVNTNSITDEAIVSYVYNTDNTLGNNKGFDNFYNKKTLSPYAHSYLLTALQSNDYVDITGDGMTNDDYGDYTKFNYTKTSSAYLWRNPVTGGSDAIYESMYRSDPLDDKGIIASGSKELWYVHSIETKNYVAEFYLSDRDDCSGVSMAGSIQSNGNNTPKKLDKIVLYSKHDLNTPIKSVHFSYEYLLCPNTPNSNGGSSQGKLTLMKIHFTYSKSEKGVFNPYEFIYCDGDHDGNIDSNLNPPYNRNLNDRWGNYQQTSTNFPNNNNDFPYTKQDSVIANENASAWLMSSIITPAKSKINVHYESDEYAYIQNKVPGQMLTMVDFKATEPSVNYQPGSVTNNTTADLYDVSTFTAMPNNWMIIDLSALNGGGIIAANGTVANSILKEQVLPVIKGKDQFYFRAFVKVGNYNSSQNEYIPGYTEYEKQKCKVLNSNAVTLSNGNIVYKYAVVKLKDVDIEDDKNYINNSCNPISKAGWQFTRLFLPKIAFPGSEPGNSVLSALAGLMASYSQVLTFKQKNKRLRKKEMSARIYPGISMIRVNIPNKSKFGGGHRVSKIEITDNWNSMIGSEATSIFGQTYDYSLVENGNLISSGVTSYEPYTGGDENSLREPLEYSVNKVAAPDDAHFVEEPIGESFFPPPLVIYRKVVVRNLDRKDVSNNVITSNIGRTEYEFYTAKEFPIYSEMDKLQSEIYLPDPEGDLFNCSMESAVFLSQGFLLKLNNMHGKLKSVLTFQEKLENPISGTKYFYKTTTNQSELDNKISVIGESGVISQKLIGQHVEAVTDSRNSTTETFGKSMNFNLNISLIPTAPPIPIPIPFLFLGQSTETRDFNSASLSKVVTQNGILYKIESINDYATSVTENLVWDAKTHEVVLSKTTTNYRDYNYSYSTPAYWVYEGMGGAFQNVGYGFKNVVNTTTGVISLTNGLLKEGDEVELIYTDGATDAFKEIYPDRLWINKTSSSLTLIDRKGNLCCTTGSNTNNVFTGSLTPSGSNNFVLKVIRSGYRNQLLEDVEALTFVSNPVSGGAIVTATANTNILSASAQEYSENWSSNCSEVLNCASPTFTSSNPYILNTKGNWRSVRTYEYLGKRSEKSLTSVKDIRKDGAFETYKSFFKYNTSWKEVYQSSRSDYSATSPFDNWILMSEITKISPMGNVIEAKDAINRYTSAQYGYNQTLKTVSAVNARQREIGYDGFEDYYSPNFCRDKHFIFRNYFIAPTSLTAHTGVYSMSLSPTGQFVFEIPLTSPDCETIYGYNNFVLTNTTIPQSGVNESNAPASGFGTETRTFAPITASCSTCATNFSPMANWPLPQKYLFSLWFKESSLSSNGTYAAPKCSFGFSLTATTPKFKSTIINGWQKFDYEFEIPPYQTGYYLIAIENTSTSKDLFIDDVRAQNYYSTMNAYVYDPRSLRLWSELDDRNFATFYEYNNEGVLVRVKKETDKGVVTIKETRNSFKKN